VGESKDEDAADENDKALPSIPARDRLAFVQIGVASGEMRIGAALLAKGIERPADARALRQLRPRVASLHPRDEGLARLRNALLIALDRALEARREASPTPGGAQRTLAAADRILRGLRRYTSSNPGVRGLIPD
jgi:hypothetical protein